MFCANCLPAAELQGADMPRSYARRQRPVIDPAVFSPAKVLKGRRALGVAVSTGGCTTMPMTASVT